MKERPYILIVDDDPDIIEGILMILETQPYRLATARDGKQCMAKIKQEVPDVLILDLLMPRMDGWGVIREMRSDPRFSKVPIMILSTVIEDASHRRYELETGMAMDIQGYVQKPAKPADLLQRIEVILEKHRHKRE
jgi:two-component system alkaline phosphatase synthesis response regulator PhoP